ncbi:MAG: hypothetical protein CMQ39_01620 [Gammaproteobacteria bacterium]|nr:hypothetical protein [Gammaproteobacteria bacterium]
MNKRSTNSRKTTEKIQTFIIGFFLGCLSSFSLSSWFLYLNAGSVNVVKEESAAVENFVPEEQEYQFWEMFPANEVEVERFKVRDKKYSSKEKIWEIQAGSFNEYDDANEVRVSLILLGLEARVEIISIENQNRYRVLLGPYNKKDKVTELEKLLKENDIETIARTISPEQSQTEFETP